MAEPLMIDEVVVFGLGLIGGSTALALKTKGVASRVVAVDLPEALRPAAAKRAADALVSAHDRAEVDAACGRASLVLLATPVSAIMDLLPRVLDGRATITDCGSTKRQIAARASRQQHGACFVPGHPMAGWPASGLENARADLFEGQSWILCPEHSDPQRVEQVRSLVSALGARPVLMSAQAHDRAVAVCSHLPRLVASALVAMADEADAARATGPAFDRLTRAAGGSQAIWSDVFATNADELASAVRQLCQRLDRVGEELGQEPYELGSALDLLREAERWRCR